MMQSNNQRSGKWTEQEEAFAQALMDSFHSGHLEIDEGVSLRKLLAKKLKCSAKRVSKKYEGTNYRGKMQYARDFSIPEEDVKERKAQLDALEQNFLQSVAETDAQEACRRATMSRSLAVANSGFTRSGAGPSLPLYPPASMSAVLPSSSSTNSFGSVPTADSASLARVGELTQMMAARALSTSNPGWTTSPQLTLSNASLAGMISPGLAALARQDSLPPGMPVLGRQDSLPTSQDSLLSVASIANAARLSREGRVSEFLSNNLRPFGLPPTSSLLPAGMDPLLSRSGNWSLGQLQASLYGASNRTNPSLDAMRLQMLQRDSLGQAAARSAAMSRNQAEIMARDSELAHLQRMLDHQEATLRQRNSTLIFAQGTSLPPAATELQQTGKRSHPDARAEEKDCIEGRPSPKRANYRNRDT